MMLQQKKNFLKKHSEKKKKKHSEIPAHTHYECLKFKRLALPNTSRSVEQLGLSYPAAGDVKLSSHFENSLAAS